jgi:hypothetical protein
MGYLKDQLIDNMDKVEETIHHLPEILAEADRKTLELRRELDSLKADYEKETSTFEKYKGYIISAIIGGIAGALIAKLF